MGRVLKLMGAEAGKESLISLLLIQSVFLGIFLGSFDITAHSLFLSVLDEKMMARAYVLSGFAGIILTMLYAKLETKIKFHSLSFLSLAFITTVTTLIWALLSGHDDRWIVWLLFLSLGPVNILAVQDFRRTANHFYRRNPHARASRATETGIIAGVILISLSVAASTRLNIKVHNILLAGVVSVIIVFAIRAITLTRLLKQHENRFPETGMESGSLSAIKFMKKDSFLRKLVFFTGLSVMAALFIQYSFMAGTRINYPSAVAMARFLGLFTAGMMILVMILRFIFSQFLIRRTGLRFCLLISPVLIALFALISAGVGFISGYPPEALAGYALFFMMLTLTRLFSGSLRESVEPASLKVIFRPLEEKTSSFFATTVKEAAVVLAGIVLIALGMIGSVRIIHFPIILILISFLWLIAAVRLYSEFRDLLLKEVDKEDEETIVKTAPARIPVYNNRFSASLEFKHDYFSILSGHMECLKQRTDQYYQVVLEKAENDNDITLIPALKKISSDKELDETVRQRSAKIAESLELYDSDSPPEDDKLFEARKVLSGTRVPQTTLILRLLRDKSTSLKRTAIFMIGKFRMKEMINEVCECLFVQGLEFEAVEVLKSFGSDADKELLRFSLLSSGNNRISIVILRLLAENNTSENTGLLFARLISPSRTIKEIALGKLASCGFIPSEAEKSKLNSLISDTIGTMVWNLSARICIKREKDVFLAEAFDKEISRLNRFLFDLLSLAYNRSAMKKIKTCMEEGSAESKGFAIEMIGLLFNEPMRSKVISVLEESTDENKVRQLSGFYPAEIPEYERLMEEIINRDYNLLGICVRACMLRNMKDIPSDGFGESVVALLFNPEIILQEEAAGLLARAGKELYDKVSARIPQGIRERTGMITSGDAVKETLILEKAKFLASRFSGLVEEDLLSLAGSLSFTEKSMKRTLPGKGGYILWECTSDNARIVYEQDIISELTYVLPLTALEDYCNHNTEKAGVILDYFAKIRS